VWAFVLIPYSYNSGMNIRIRSRKDEARRFVDAHKKSAKNFWNRNLLSSQRFERKVNRIWFKWGCVNITNKIVLQDFLSKQIGERSCSEKICDCCKLV
jgi:hypothetical protein